jgi:hypothetical protein
MKNHSYSDASSVAAKTFQVWREISPRTCSAPMLFLKTYLRAKRLGIGWDVRPFDLFDDVYGVSPSRKVSLALVSPGELGFVGREEGDFISITHRQIEKRALELGLSLCPRDTAPRILLQLPLRDFEDGLSTHSEFSSKRRRRFCICGGGGLYLAEDRDVWRVISPQPQTMVFEIIHPVF